MARIQPSTHSGRRRAAGGACGTRVEPPFARGGERGGIGGGASSVSHLNGSYLE